MYDNIIQQEHFTDSLPNVKWEGREKALESVSRFCHFIDPS